MSHLFKNFFRSLIVLLCFVPAVPAHASGLVLIDSQVLAMVQSISGPNQCVAYTYDLNGNRTTQNSTSYGAPGRAWGSAVYGCFSWAK